jgi:hypothetical protein
MQAKARATVESWRKFALGTALLLLVALVGQTLAGAVNELNSDVATYLLGESYWSKGREAASLHLYRYATERDPAQLALARRALDVQLGDRDARLALDREPPDIDAARDGFLRGMNPPDNLDRIIWTYRWFHATPPFRDAIDKWREADPSLLRIAALASELEVAVNASDEAAIKRLGGELVVIDGHMRVLQNQFLDAMIKTGQWVRRMLVLFSAAGFTALTLVAALLLRAIVRRVRASEEFPRRVRAGRDRHGPHRRKRPTARGQRLHLRRARLFRGRIAAIRFRPRGRRQRGSGSARLARTLAGVRFPQPD